MARGGMNRLEELDNQTCKHSPSVHVYYRKRSRKVYFHFPEELIIEILKRLPVESLIRFMCVCKSWCSLISDASFISTHLAHQSNSTIQNTGSTLYRFGSRLFLHNLNEPLDKWVEIDPSINNMGVIVGSCHGVICLFDYFAHPRGPLILWNPSIRKALSLPLNMPSIDTEGFTIVSEGCPNFTLGFGFDPVSNDYKVVRLVYNWREESKTTYLYADVFSLTKGKWRTSFTRIEGYKFIVECTCVHVHGVIHWMCKRKHDNAITAKTVLTFDLANEQFGQIFLPVGVTSDSIAVLMSVKTVEDKLSVSCKDSGGNVWVMEEYGASKSWRRLIDFYLGDNVGTIKGAMITEDCKTVVATSAGNWISWDANNCKIENHTLPVLEADYVNTYFPSLVLLGYKNQALGCKEIHLQKKRNKGMTAREYRGYMRLLKLKCGGYLT